jgi:hypothetical protein
MLLIVVKYIVPVVFFYIPCYALLPLVHARHIETDHDTITPKLAFKTLTINNGLSQNSVISITQDSMVICGWLPR